uniref:Reverse transcriptase Ty1/copia-type domain-containing protein n=1 Tax=Physcomitrium patens TaxID=3218 RepID=A0A2K1KLQ9_PHYPA|nr:hypothetical protein PHYPA_005613 [Physcomitrium patens]
MNKPQFTHLVAIKKILEYLKDTIDHEIVYSTKDKQDLLTFTNAY